MSTDLDAAVPTWGASPQPSNPPPPAPAGSAVSPHAPSAAPGGSWLTSNVNDFKSLPVAAPSVVGAIGDVMETPFIAADALVRGGHPYNNWQELGKVYNEVRTKGMRGLQDVNDRYSLMAPEQLKDEADNGDPIAGHFLRHPGQAMVADFVGEMANPSNWIVPPVARVLGKGGELAAHQLGRIKPGSADVNLGQALRDQFDAQAPLVEEAHKEGLNPQQARRLGQNYTGASAHAAVKAEDLKNLVFGTGQTASQAMEQGGVKGVASHAMGLVGTTPEEANEIERRSENSGRFGRKATPGDPYWQQPVPASQLPGKLTDAELDQRARRMRAVSLWMDRALVKMNPELGKRMIREGYTQRFGKNYWDPSASPGDLEQMDRMRESNPGAPAGAGMKGSLAPNIHKLYMTQDAARASGNLRPDYDARVNFAEYLRKRLTMLERGRVGQEFAGMKSTTGGRSFTQPIDWSDPKTFNWPAADTQIMRGIGPERAGYKGYQNMKRVIARQAAAESKQKAQSKLDAILKQHGLPSSGNASTDLMRVRKYIKALPGPNTALKADVMDYIASRRTARKEVASQIFDKAVSSVTDEAIHNKVNINMSVTPSGGRYANVVHPPLRGFAPEEGNMVTSLPGLGKYLEAQGAEPEMAKGITRITQVINKLARMSIISNPIVHVIWNLNGQYLGARGNARDLLDIWNLGKGGWHPTAAQLKEAADHGALAHFAPQATGMAGLDEGRMMNPYDTLKPTEKLDKFGTSLWNWQQHFVFEVMESRYAVKLFEQFKRGGLSADEAGLRVRKVLGDYANISKSGIEKHLNEQLFFYPWLKTLVPFWFNALGEHPQAITAPYEAIRTNNELSGDPNLDRENPYAIHTEGENYLTLPLPQKTVQQFGSIVAPRGDVLGDATGAQDRIGAAMSIAQSHAAPVWEGLGVPETWLQEPQEPGGPEDTFFNKDRPLWQQFLQGGQTFLDKATPIPPGLRSLTDLAGEAAEGKRSPTSEGTLRSAGESAVEAITGGYNSDRMSPGVSKRLYALQEKLNRLHAAAERQGMLNSPQYVNKTVKAYIDAMNALQKRENDQ